MRTALSWLLPALVLLLLVTVVGFRTTDPRAMVRIKTAPQVWSVVGPNIAEVDAGLPLSALYAGALLMTLAGAFVLIWATSQQARTRPHESALAKATEDKAHVTLAASDAWRACSSALRSEAASPAMLRAHRAVLPPGTLVVPTGGIERDTIRPWLEAGAAGVGLGSSLYRPGRGAGEVGERAAALVAAARAART